jgi:LCP family protein required for cell wall assembly
MNDRTESLVREAFAAEAERAPDPRPVLAALASGRRRRGPSVAIVLAAAVVVAVAAVVVPQVLQPAGDGASPGQAPPSADENLVLAGTDDHGLADSIMLVHLGGDGDIAVLSLPRDSYVRAPDGSHKRLNAVERDLGPEALLETVRDLTGVTVDHYGFLPMGSFGPISEAVGGVPVCLNRPTSDPMTGVSFPKGPQQIARARALAFLRQRHGLDEGELDRMRRQQAFVRGVLGRVTEDDTDLGALLEVVGENARLDPDWDLAGTANQLLDDRPKRLRLGTIPIKGVIDTPGNGTAFEVDPQAVRAYVAEQLGEGRPDVTTSGRPQTREDRPQDYDCVD